MFDPDLRTQVVYDIAVRYSGPLWPLGAIIRACCVSGLWLLLIWFPAGALVRAALFLLLATVGVVTAWAHTRSTLLDRLADLPVPGLRQAARHLGSTQGRATADLSGIAESVGIVLAMLLYTGPVAVRPLPVWVYLTGLGLAAAHVWSAWSQVMTDASWYNRDPGPSEFLLWFRPLMPVAVAGVAFILDGWREITGQGSPPGGLAVALLLAGSVLLLLPYTLLVELILRSALHTFDVQISDVRVADASTVHSLVKNAAHTLVWQARSDLGLEAETRSLISQLLVGTEEARQLILGGDVAPDSVDLLWRSVRTIVPKGLRDNVLLDQDSYQARLSKTDYGLARRVLQDLITNSWKADSASIRVEVRAGQEPTGQEPGGWVSVRVDDDGSGVAPGELSDPRSSLHVLKDYLRHFGGIITLSAGSAGGTLAEARWRSSRW
jgi:signal transduction histidine kinase